MAAYDSRKGGAITDQKPPYYEFVLGLFQSPFSPEPDNQFYFPTHAFEQRLAMLRRMALGKDSIVLVIGEKGSGKSMLLNQYLETTGASWRRCKIKAYDKRTSSRVKSLDHLDDRSAYILREGQSPLVFMDDAHELSDKELQHLLQNTISTVSATETKRLILFGDSSLKAKLESLPTSVVSKTPVNTIYIPPFSLEETAEYLQHRLAVAGLKGKNPFSAAKVKSIYKASAGLPAQINVNAHKVLEKIFTPKPWFSSVLQTIGDNKKIGIMAVSIGLVVCITLFFAFDGYRYFFPKPTVQKSVREHKPRAVKRNTVRKGRTQSVKKPATQIQQPKSAISLPKPAPDPKPVAKPTPKPQKSPPKIVPQQSAPSVSASAKQPFREDWLLNQSKTSYTVQILGARDETALLAFIENAPLPKDAEVAYFVTRHKGSRWYSLLCGVYPDKKTAQSVVAALPVELKRRSPWVRSMASVQTAIRKYSN